MCVCAHVSACVRECVSVCECACECVCVFYKCHSVGPLNSVLVSSGILLSGFVSLSLKLMCNKNIQQEKQLIRDFYKVIADK